MKENSSYKIVALLITLILWVIILGSKEAVTVKFVNIEFILPQNMTIINNTPREIAFKAAGPRLLLKKFNELNEPLVIDLSHVDAGTTTVRIHADSINTPPGVRILNMSPSTVTAKIEKSITKAIPIDINTKGKLPGNKKVLSMKAIPPTWELAGAASVVNRIQAVGTAPIDLSEIKNSQTIDAEIILDEIGLEVPKSHKVKVEIVINE